MPLLIEVGRIALGSIFLYLVLDRVLVALQALGDLVRLQLENARALLEKMLQSLSVAYDTHLKPFFTPVNFVLSLLLTVLLSVMITAEMGLLVPSFKTLFSEVEAPYTLNLFQHKWAPSELVTTAILILSLGLGFWFWETERNTGGTDDHFFNAVRPSVVYTCAWICLVGVIAGSIVSGYFGYWRVARGGNVVAAVLLGLLTFFMPFVIAIAAKPLRIVVAGVAALILGLVCILAVLLWALFSLLLLLAESLFAFMERLIFVIAAPGEFIVRTIWRLFPATRAVLCPLQGEKLKLSPLAAEDTPKEAETSVEVTCKEDTIMSHVEEQGGGPEGPVQRRNSAVCMHWPLATILAAVVLGHFWWSLTRISILQDQIAELRHEALMSITTVSGLRDEISQLHRQVEEPSRTTPPTTGQETSSQGVELPPGVSPKIEFVQVPELGAGPDSKGNIGGRVVGVPDPEEYKIVLYALTDLWYVQPLILESLTDISPDGTWQNWTHLGEAYAALLVKPPYTPLARTGGLPAAGGKILAVAQVDARE